MITRLKWTKSGTRKQKGGVVSVEEQSSQAWAPLGDGGFLRLNAQEGLLRSAVKTSQVQVNLLRQLRESKCLVYQMP